MKILLTAVNAKYIHSNLAVYSLKAFAKAFFEEKGFKADFDDVVEIAEYTINNYVPDILQGIYEKRADVVMFSCYIWNIEVVKEVGSLLKKVAPDVSVWVGGPEVSYDAETFLSKNPAFDGVLCGEGEESFAEVVYEIVESRGAVLGDLTKMSLVDGVFVREGSYTPRLYRKDLNHLPFVYEDMSKFKNKIIYYESSRGCPFSCSYCLSSIDKGVRFRSLELVECELQFFIDAHVSQVKFVDRTFNCSHRHTMGILKYIKEHDLGVTNFHFEITADLLNDEEIDFMKTLRPGLIQLEIGVQSTNPKTIEAIHRTVDFIELSKTVHCINEGKNIHQHLDLIAGLPYEDYERFRVSFNDVYALEPEQLQLGFLKVLKGSCIHELCGEYGIVYQTHAPYEVLSTNWLSYDDLLKLKGVEDMVEVYYNSHQFEHAIAYLEHRFETPFDLYAALADYYKRNSVMGEKYSRLARYDMLLSFVKERWPEDECPMIDLMTYDLYLREKLKSRPVWTMDNSRYKNLYQDFYADGKNLEHYFAHYEGYQPKQIKNMTHIEAFNTDVCQTSKTGQWIQKQMFVLFDYKKRNPLNYEAEAKVVRLEA